MIKKSIAVFVASLGLSLSMLASADKPMDKAAHTASEAVQKSAGMKKGGDVPAHKMVNINSASAAELGKQLTGVGPKIAAEIVNYREKHGPFKSLEDLGKVKYVGKSVLEKNKDSISFQ